MLHFSFVGARIRLKCLFENSFIHTHSIIHPTDFNFSALNYPCILVNKRQLVSLKKNKSKLQSSKSVKHIKHAIDNSILSANENEFLHTKIYRYGRQLSFVINPIDSQRVYILNSDRERALHGDYVLVRIQPLSAWLINGIKSGKNSLKAKENLFPVDEIELEDTTFEETEDLSNATLVSSNPIEETITDATDITSSVTNTISAPNNFKQNDLVLTKDVVIDSVGSSDRDNICSRSPYVIHSLLNVKQYLDNNADYPELIPKKFFEAFKDKTYTFYDSVPHPNLIRTASVVRVVRSNPENLRVLGRIALIKTKADLISTPSLAFLRKNISNKTATCLFIPVNKRQSIIKLDPFSVPKDVWLNPQLGMDSKFVCQITGWHQKSNLPFGKVCDEIGDVGCLEAATKRVLIEHGIQDEEFKSEHLRGLPLEGSNFKIPSVEFTRRRDFRDVCIFTVDPESAKDFDDALHIRKIESDLYEVGIHVADVSYFVRSDTPLDMEAAKRTTSVYLVNKVIPMLPPVLSEHLCSLVPGENRLAFSVLLFVNGSGDVVNEWYGRSIIRSRARLSYMDALSIMNLENESDPIERSAKIQNLPKPEQPFTFDDLKTSLCLLNNIATNLRKSRINHGALVIDKVQLEFDFNKQTNDDQVEHSNEYQKSSFNKIAYPRGFSIKDRNQAHFLIEEWMILANQSVAQRLFHEFVKSKIVDSQASDSTRTGWNGGVLRRHPDPDAKKMEHLVKTAQLVNLHIDVETSLSISNSMNQIVDNLVRNEIDSSTRDVLVKALSYMIYKRLKLALYFNLDSVDKRNTMLNNANYLLNIPTSMSELRELINNPTRIDHRSAPAHSESSSSFFDYTWHYGLCIPLYTHFTSPIRRYADLIVHRQLAHILGCDNWFYPALTNSTNNNSTIAQHHQKPLPGSSALDTLDLHLKWCNDRRLKARRAGEESQKLFLTASIKECGPLYATAVVIDLTSTQVELFLGTYGLVCKQSMDSFLKAAESWKYVHNPHPLVWPSWSLADMEKFPPDHKKLPGMGFVPIHPFCLVPCKLSCENEKLHIEVEFVPPNNLDSDTIDLINQVTSLMSNSGTTTSTATSTPSGDSITTKP